MSRSNSQGPISEGRILSAVKHWEIKCMDLKFSSYYFLFTNFRFFWLNKKLCFMRTDCFQIPLPTLSVTDETLWKCLTRRPSTPARSPVSWILMTEALEKGPQPVPVPWATACLCQDWTTWILDWGKQVGKKRSCCSPGAGLARKWGGCGCCPLILNPPATPTSLFPSQLWAPWGSVLEYSVHTWRVSELV